MIVLFWDNNSSSINTKTSLILKDYNLNKKIDDNYSVKCSFSYTKDGTLVDTGNDDIVDNVFACNIVDIKTKNDDESPFSLKNNFPSFEFWNLNNRLSPLELKDYSLTKKNNDDVHMKMIIVKSDGDDKKFVIDKNRYTFKDVMVRKKTLLNQERRARLIALKIVEQFLKLLSYGPEFAMLDLIRIIEKNKGFKGIYNMPTAISTNTKQKQFDSVTDELTYSNNLRTIQAVIPEIPISKPAYYYNQTNKKIEKFIDYNIYHKNDENYNNVTFDIFSVFHTLVHEYGHHLSLFDGKITAKSFFNKLSDLYLGDGKNTRFNDFVELYKYYNSLNENSNNNYNNRKRTVKTFTAYDKKMLKLHRKYFSGNIVKLRSKLSEYSDDPKWQQRTYNDLYIGLLRETRGKRLPVDLKAAVDKALILDSQSAIKINEEAYNKLLKLIEKESYNVYYWDKDDSFNFNDGDDPLRVTNFWLVSKSFDDIANRSPILVGDVFHNSKYVLNQNDPKDKLAKRISIKANACANQPLTFTGGSPHNYEAENYYSTTSDQWNQHDYELSSAYVDVNVLNDMAYYYSWKELVARLFAVLTFQYPDRRNQLTECARDYSRLVNVSGHPLAYSFSTSAKVKSIELFHDYGKFKAFGIDIFSRNNSKELFKFIIKANDELGNPKNVSFFLSKNNLKTSIESHSTEKNYFVSNNYYPALKPKITRGSFSLYTLITAYIKNKNDRFKIKIQFFNNNIRQVEAYDYMHYTFYNSNKEESVSIDDFTALEKLQIWDKTHVVSLVSWLDSSNLNTLLSSFQKMKNLYGTIKRVWIDTNNDDQYNDNETMLLRI